MENSVSEWRRRRHVNEIGFVVPNSSLAKFLASFGPWIEIGAGTGALSAAIKAVGGTSVPTDNFTWPSFDDGKWRIRAKSNSVMKIDAAEAVGWLSSPRYSHFGLLSAWPSHREDWCFRAVSRLLPGQRFGYIGEARNGCTGDDQLHDFLAENFDEIADHPVHRLARRVRDHCTVYRRRGC